MDRINKISILIFLMTFTSCGSGFELPKPDKLEVDILDGEVTVVWVRPKDAPLKALYNVQMGRYGESWTNVTNCMGIEETYCDLTHLIQEHYLAPYKVRVQLIMEDSVSDWTVIKKFLPNYSKLRPPSITLVASSTSLTVKVHAKPIYKKLFPFGVTYRINLQASGVNLQSYDIKEDTKTFHSLKRETEYCVSVMVLGEASRANSSVSSPECLLLPKDEWYIVAVSCLPIMGVLTAMIIVLAIICCFLRHPEKTPAALKSPQSSWSPLMVKEAPMETVTDQAWLLIMPRGKVKDCSIAKHNTNIMITPDVYVNEGGEKGKSPTNTDSGVSMLSIEKRKPSQADSGCVSMGGSESSASYDRVNTRKREDSGMDCSESAHVQDADLQCECIHTGTLESTVPMHCHSDELNTDPVPKPDRKLKPRIQSGGVLECHSVPDDGSTSYRIQIHPAMQIHAHDGDGSLHQNCMDTTDTALAEVVSSYRPGRPQSCESCGSSVCSETYQCMWCQTTTGQDRTKAETQYRNPHAGDGFLCFSQHIVGTSEQDMSFPSYHPKSETIVSMGELETSNSILDAEAFPFLTTLSTMPCLVVDGDISCSMNTVPLSLCDVELSD